MARPRPIAAAVLTAVLLAAGCQSDTPDRVDDPGWRRVTLPAPPGEPGRLMLRDAAACGGHWYVVGAVATPDGGTRPAAWTSTDAQSWTSVPLAAKSYYGVRNILYSVGCHAGRIAVIGAKAGGAHGNPRVRTWHQLADGSLSEVEAEFLLYGGPTAVSVNRIAGGPSGWLIAGTRSSGAAVWVSPDAAAFQIVEGAPNLASGAGLTTSAIDVTTTADGWVVGGSGRSAGRSDRDALVWTSADGRHWTRVALPASGEDEAVQRLIRLDGGVLAVGVRGGEFGAWRGDGTGATGWRAAGEFGATGAGAVAGVDAVAMSGNRVLAATTGAEGHRLWSAEPTGAGWLPVPLPAAVPAGGDTAASVAAAGGRALVVTDDGVTAGAWLAIMPSGA
jgi:hypothetical protein